MDRNKIILPQKLTVKDAFLFPVDSPEGRKDVLIGGVLLIFLLIIGWILNLGNRLNVVSRLSKNDKPYFRGFRPFWYTFIRGCISFLTISMYLAPSVIFGALTFYFRSNAMEIGHYLFALLSALAFITGVFTLPGCMTVYAVEDRPEVLRKPLMAFRRAWKQRTHYLKAWGIGLLSVILSFFGLLGLGIGFIFTSVWSWEVVGYVFTVAMYMDPDEKSLPAD